MTDYSSTLSKLSKARADYDGLGRFAAGAAAAGAGGAAAVAGNRLMNSTIRPLQLAIDNGQLRSFRSGGRVTHMGALRGAARLVGSAGLMGAGIAAVLGGVAYATTRGAKADTAKPAARPKSGDGPSVNFGWTAVGGVAGGVAAINQKILSDRGLNLGRAIRTPGLRGNAAGVIIGAGVAAYSLLNAVSSPAKADTAKPAATTPPLKSQRSAIGRQAYVKAGPAAVASLGAGALALGATAFALRAGLAGRFGAMAGLGVLGSLNAAAGGNAASRSRSTLAVGRARENLMHRGRTGNTLGIPRAHLDQAAASRTAAHQQASRAPAPSAAPAGARPGPSGGRRQSYTKLDGTSVEATAAQAAAWEKRRK